MPNARPVAEHLRCCAHVLDHAALQHAGLQYVLGAAERAGPALGLCLQPRTAQVATMPRPTPHFSPVGGSATSSATEGAASAWAKRFSAAATASASKQLRAIRASK